MVTPSPSRPCPPWQLVIADGGWRLAMRGTALLTAAMDAGGVVTICTYPVRAIDDILKSIVL
jgi:hypothetical protein